MQGARLPVSRTDRKSLAMNYVVATSPGTLREPVRSRRHTGIIALTSACPVGLTTVVVTASPVLSALIAVGTATCVAVAGAMI